MKSSPVLHWSFYTFVPFTAGILFLDSQWVFSRGVNGRILADIWVPLYFLAMVLTLPDPRLKKIMWLAVGVSGAGELILSQGLELWIYKFGYVPFYVPFGHGIVIGSGFQLLDWAAPADRSRLFIRIALSSYAGLFLGAFLFFRDSFTLVLGLLFFAGIAAMRKRVIYLIMPVFVLFVELVGTAFGCWYWPPRPFEVLATTNPPMGSVMFYVYLDMIVMMLGGIGAASGIKKAATA